MRPELKFINLTKKPFTHSRSRRLLHMRFDYSRHRTSREIAASPPSNRDVSHRWKTSIVYEVRLKEEIGHPCSKNHFCAFKPPLFTFGKERIPRVLYIGVKKER